MDNETLTQLKLRINEFVWQNGPADMSLERAERVAVRMLDDLLPENNRPELHVESAHVLRSAAGFILRQSILSQDQILDDIRNAVSKLDPARL